MCREHGGCEVRLDAFVPFFEGEIGDVGASDTAGISCVVYEDIEMLEVFWEDFRERGYV